MDILSKIYTNRPGTTDLGKEYEIKMAALLILRCINQNNTTDAWLAMNVNHCGAFDDMVLYRQKKEGNEVIYLIQLKHEERGSDLRAEEFKSKKKSPFLLSKYVNSICKINESVARKQVERLKLTAKNEDLQFDEKGHDLVDFILHNHDKIAFIIFTNRGTTTGCIFLSHVSRKSAMDTQWMLYETINTTTKGSAFKFVFEKLDVYPSNPVPIENFFIFTKQEHVKKLSAALSNAIKSLIQPVKLSEDDLSDVCLKFLQFMINWSKGSLGGYYQLTKHQVLKQLAQLLLEPYVVKLTDPSTRAVVHKTDTWNQIIMNADVTIINQADDLSLDFVLDSITTIIEQHYRSVDDWWADNGDVINQEVHAPKKTFSHIYHYLWRVRKIPVLLEVCDSKHVCQIQDIMKFSQGIFRVVVLNKGDNPIESVNTLKMFINIGSLNDSDRETILLQPFTLQGRQSLVPLKNVVDPRNVTHITVKDVIYILAQKFNIGDKPEALPEFFEETSLLRVWLDISVLLHISSEMFIVKCSNLGILKVCLQERHAKAPNLSVLLWPDIKDNSEGVIIVYKAKEDLSEIEHYCLKKGKPFHQLIFYDSGNLEWIKSSGSVTNIKSFRRDSTWKPLTKTELITDIITKRKPTLVSSDPGMGKSVLIKYIARNVPSSWWTLKLNLAEHRDVYNVWETENPSVQLFNSFVSTLVCQKSITDSLEEVVFQRIYQEIFLKNYFAREANSVTSDERIKSFVNNLLNATERNLNDHDNLFVGVPLQTVLLAQVFSKNCVKYLQTGEFECKHFDLLFLYRHFFKEKLQISRTKVEGVSEDSISHYKVCRSFYVLQLIFSEDDLGELQIGKRLLQASEMFSIMILLIQKDGVIVAEKENKVFFVHRTFAEYLTAEWLAENINGEYKAHAQRLIVKIFQPSFEVVRNIFDRLMAQGCHLHLAIINRQITKIQEIINSDPEVYKEKDKGGRTFLHIIASWGQHHPVQKFTSMKLGTLRRLVAKDDMMKILKLIPSCELMNNCKDNILNYTPLDLAIFSGALNVANVICARLNRPYYFELVKTLKNRKEYMYKMNYNSLYYIFSKYGFSNSTLPQSVCYKDRNLGELLVAIEAADMNAVSSWISKQKNINVSDASTGYTSLHMAIIYERPEIATMLLHHKADSTKIDNSGRTPFHWALSRNMETANPKHQSSCKIDIENLSIKQFSSASGNTWDNITLMLIDLLANGEYIDIKDNDGNTALHLAAHSGHIDAIKKLLCQGAYIEVKNSSEDTPLITSAYQGRTDIVDLLLSWGANKEAKNVYGQTALLAAILVGQTVMTDFLLSKGFCVESKGKGGHTSLLIAATGGHTDIATLLLSHGSDVNAKNEKSNTALMIATFNGHIDIVNLLLLHDADIEAKRDDGNTALLVTSHQGLSDILSLLLSRGADKEARNKEGDTALTIAVFCRHVDVIEELLLWDVDKEAVDFDGNTALSTAAFLGYADVVKVLLSRGCNKEAVNKQGDTPLILAARNCHIDVVLLLLSNNIYKEAKSNTGFTALAAASDNGHIDMVRLLLSHNSDKESENTDGNTPLLLAARNGHAEIVNLLICHGANREAKNWKGKTALASAAREGHINVVNLLISLEADIEARTIEEATPLILAAWKGHADVVQFLLSQRSNKEARTTHGDSALILAARQGHLDVVKVLLLHGCDKNVKNNQGNTVAMTAASSGKIEVVRLLCSEDSENMWHDVCEEGSETFQPQRNLIADKKKFCIIS